MKNLFNKKIFYILISLAFLVTGGLIFQLGLTKTAYADSDIACKSTYAPSELGIGDCRICNRLHQFVLKAPLKGGTGTCEQNDTCTKSEDCQQNTDQPKYVDPVQSRWCFGFKDGARCVQLRYIGDEKEPSCRTGDVPRPTQCDSGGGGPCDLGNQTPGLTEDCATCIATNEAGTINSIRSATGQSGCSNQKVLNFWCNGGVSAEGSASCARRKSNCSACSGTGGNPAATSPGSASCTTGNFDSNLCRSCANSVWAAEGSNWGDSNTNKAAWCACARKYNPTTKTYPAAEIDRVCAVDKSPAPTAAPTAALTATIQGVVVDDKGKGVKGVKVWVRDEGSATKYRGGPYKSVITGDDGKYSAPVTIGPDGYFVRVPNSDAKNADGTPIADGVSNDAFFSVEDKNTLPPADISDNDTKHKSYEFQPFNNVSKGCWNDCNFTVKLRPAATTVAFRIAESPADLDKASWQDYTADGMTVPVEFKDGTPGPKFVWVDFKDSTGKTERRNTQITLLGADPTITSCSLSLEGNNAVLNLTGQNFGPTKGTVKGGETDLQVKAWKDDSVQVVWPNAPTDQALNVDLTSSTGQSGSGTCSPVSQLALGAKVFCRQPFSHKTDNVDLTIAESFEGGASRVKQKVSIDKDGVVQGLSKKLEQDKKYTLSIRAPKSLRRSVTFIAGDGTTNIPNFILPVGDIFPLESGDGRINSYDKAELNRQWLISSDAQNRSADFNQDLRVNSIDYACMRVSMPDSIRGEDPEPVAGVDTPVTIFCGGVDSIQCPTGGTCKLDGDYPNASGKCIGVPAPSSPSPSPSPLPSASPDMVSCTQVSDCACGTNTVTKQCAVGKKEYIDENKQCPDFCTGIGGTLRSACENKVCVVK